MKEGFPSSSADKESACNEEDLVSISWLGRSPGEEKGPTPVFWPGEFLGLYSPWGHKESDTTERLSLTYIHNYLNRIFTIEFSKVLLNGIQLSQFQLCTISLKQTDEERK